MAGATVCSIRLRLLKIGAYVTNSVRRIKVALASACPYLREFRQAWAHLFPETPLNRPSLHHFNIDLLRLCSYNVNLLTLNMNIMFNKTQTKPLWIEETSGGIHG